jgi:DNA-binding MltR family transcriptional regulator
MIDHLKALLQDNDQAAALVGAAYLDQALTSLLLTKFRPLSREEDDRFFDATTGILSSMSAKARLAYALEFFDKKEFSDALLITQIRNVFAHTLHRVSFSTPEIKQDCEALQTLDPKLTRPTLLPKHRYLFVILSLAQVISKQAKPLTLARALKEQAVLQPSPDKPVQQSPHKARRERARNRRRSQPKA